MEPVLLSEIEIYLELKKAGYSYRRISEKMDRDRQTVRRHINGYLEFGDKWLSEMQYARKKGA